MDNESKDINSLKPVDDFSRYVHSYIREHIAAADRKASFLFTCSAGLLTFIQRFIVPQIWRFPLSKWTLRECLGLAVLLLLGAAVIGAVIVIFPNLRRGQGKGFIFWESITSYASAESYSRAILQAEHMELIDSILTHCYTMAQVCRRKYRILNIAIIFATIGFGLALLLLAMMPTAGQ